MIARPAATEERADALTASRALFHEDVRNRNGVTRTEADEVLVVLDQLIAANPPRLVHMPNRPKAARPSSVVKFGLNPTGRVFWAAHPGPVYGAKFVVLPKADEGLDAVVEGLRATFQAIDRGAWRKAHPADPTPTLEIRCLRSAKDFDRVIKAMADALAAL
jgi:hypothetical protein